MFPVHPNVQLTASGLVTLGNFTKYTFESNCSFQKTGKNVEGDVANTSLHQQFFLGVGADFLFGSG